MTSGIIFTILLILAFIFVILLNKKDRLGMDKVKSLGMNPEKTLGIRTRPERLNKSIPNEFALIEFMDDGNVRFFNPHHDKLFVAPSSVVLAFGMSKGLFEQIQIYLDNSQINNPESYVPMTTLSSGVIIEPGKAFNNRSALSSKVKEIASQYNVAITSLQYQSDLKRTTARRVLVIAIVLIFLVIPLFRA